MTEMCKITYNDYKRISDRVFWLSPEYILKFNVDLFQTKPNRNMPDEKIKDNFHKEFGYTVDGQFSVKINRTFNYYLSIESTKYGVNNRVIIGVNSIYFLKVKLNTILESWFSSNSVFSRNNGKIFIPTMPNPIKIELDFGAYIEFEPSVLQINGVDTIGARVYVNSESENFFIPINTFLSFKYLIDNFNMYQSAQMMLAYIGRPEFGTNYTDMNANTPIQDGFFNRVSQNKHPTGF